MNYMDSMKMKAAKAAARAVEARFREESICWFGVVNKEVLLLCCLFILCYIISYQIIFDAYPRIRLIKQNIIHYTSASVVHHTMHHIM